MKEFDVTVIGSGPGGYVCAIRCAQLGLKTALVEKYDTLGGTCLNVGCIPSKAWLDSSERFFELNESGSDHGIMFKELKLDFKKMRERVQSVVSQTCGGISYLMKKNKITVFHGIGSFVDDNKIKITGKEEETIFSKNIVIATGSKPSSLPGIEIDKKGIITSTEALYLDKLPKHMMIIGGGVIGLELGSVYKRLGSKVSVIEYADSIIPTMDKDLGKELQKSLKKIGVDFYLGHKVEKVINKKGKVELTATNNKTGESVSLSGDKCLVCVGRAPYTDSLNLESVGVNLDDRKRVITDDQMKTNKSHIFAIGDVTTGPMLAHKAEEEGVFVAETIAGQKPFLNHHLIPGVVYTWPEVASVGYTEEQAKEKGIKYKKGAFPFKASGRARASNESQGFIKVLAVQETDEIIGVHMIGPRAADLISEAVVAMEYKASAEDICRICHAHPTYSEAFKEACLAATENRAIHI